MTGLQKYTNPWPSYRKPTLWRILNSILLTSSLPDIKLPVPPITLRPDLSDRIDDKLSTAGARVMWSGHASVYLQIPHDDGTFGVLFDPIFAQR